MLSAPSRTMAAQAQGTSQGSSAGMAAARYWKPGDRGDGAGQEVVDADEDAAQAADHRPEGVGGHRHHAAAVRVAARDLHVLERQQDEDEARSPARRAPPARATGRPAPRTGCPGRNRSTCRCRRRRPPRPAGGPAGPRPDGARTACPGIALVLEDVRRVPAAEDVGDDKSPLSLPLRARTVSRQRPREPPPPSQPSGGRWPGHGSLDAMRNSIRSGHVCPRLRLSASDYGSPSPGARRHFFTQSARPARIV